MRTSLFIGLLLALASPTPATEKEPWPQAHLTKAGSARYQLIDAAAKHYRSAHYDLFSFQGPGNQLLSDFLLCAESVPAVLRSLPLPLYAPPPESPFKIRFFPSPESYLAGGGAANTAGFYDARKQTALFQWDHFLKKPGDPKEPAIPAFDLVIHELTHLCMHQLTSKVEVWFSEGVAEYLAAAHLGRGQYRFDSPDNFIIRRIQKHTPPDTRVITLPPLANLLRATQKDWHNQTAAGPPWRTLEFYKAALLLTHYAFHGGLERREQVRQHLVQINKNTFRPANAPLLFSPLDAPEIEAALKSYWLKKGLTLSFRNR